MLSLSYRRDEAALIKWRTHEQHRQAQAKGRSTVFADYRIRVAEAIRDYGMFNRAGAPDDKHTASADRTTGAVQKKGGA